MFETRGGKRAGAGRPEKDAIDKYKLKMWRKYGAENWEKILSNPHDKNFFKANVELLKRVMPEVAKTVVSGDENDGPIRIHIEGLDE